MLRSISFLFLLLMGQIQVLAQGRPFIRNWSPRDYELHNQNWCILQDPRGIMHFGNTIGLLSFDNLRWNTYSFKPDKSRATSLAWDDKHKRILVGLDNGQFGFMQPGKNGAMEFQSLSAKIPENERIITPVWNILVHQGVLYFCTWSGIYVFEDEKWSVIHPEEGNTFHKFFSTPSGLILREQGRGLKWLSKDKVNFINGTERFADCKVDLIHESIPGSFLVGTRNQGLFTMELKKGVASIQELPGASSDFFKEKTLYCFTPLSGKRLACGTSSGGIAVIDFKGSLLDVIDKRHGLADDMVWALQQDRQGNLWAALDKGISMMEMDYPLRIFDEFHGLDGLPNAISSIQGNIVTGTNRGIFVLRKSGNHDVFERISDPGLVCKTFQLVTTSDNAEELWAACHQGMYRIFKRAEKLMLEPVLEGVSFESAFQPFPDIPLVLGGSVGEISVFRYVAKKWQEEQILSLNSEGAIKNFCLSPKGDYLWVGEKDYGLKLIPFKKILEGNFHPSQMTCYPFPSVESSEFPIRCIDGKILFAPGNGLMAYTSGPFSYLNGEFSTIRLKEMGLTSDSIFSVFRMSVSPGQNLWLTADVTRNGKVHKETMVLASGKENQVYEIRKPLKRMHGIQINDFFFDENQILWLATNDGIFRMETQFRSSTRKSFNALISRIRCLPDSNIFQGNFSESGSSGHAGIAFSQSVNQTPELPFNLNSISFSFASNQYNDAEGILFSTILDGLENNWTNWSKENSRDFSQLPEGDYVFRVKAKSNLLGVSPETTFAFSIQAPWYRSLWAYAFYFIAGLLSIRLIVVWNIRRLKALNELLERTVTSRTRELHVEKSRVEEKNREITDSIHYAKVIQTSILPKTNTITRHFDAAFILYQPRDIVSGDFYWFSELHKGVRSASSEKKTVLVVADCTGHGVPGAFMSMIGTEKLTQAIRELPEVNASAILSFLNVEVRKSLNQGNEESQSHDGMEMALCIIDHDKHSIEFAGANRPLLLFRKDKPGEYELLKSTKSGIAGFTPDDQVFESIKLQLNKGDRVYLYTDGLPDQFGGPNSKKLGTKGLMKMLTDIQTLSLPEQERSVTEFLSRWKKNEDQVDDILLMAFSV